MTENRFIWFAIDPGIGTPLGIPDIPIPYLREQWPSDGSPASIRLETVVLAIHQVLRAQPKPQPALEQALGRLCHLLAIELGEGAPDEALTFVTLGLAHRPDDLDLALDEVLLLFAQGSERALVRARALRDMVSPATQTILRVLEARLLLALGRPREGLEALHPIAAANPIDDAFWTLYASLTGRPDIVEPGSQGIFSGGGT